MEVGCWLLACSPLPFLLHSMGLLRPLRSTPDSEIWDPQQMAPASGAVLLRMRVICVHTQCTQAKLQPPLHSPNKLSELFQSCDIVPLCGRGREGEDACIPIPS